MGLSVNPKKRHRFRIQRYLLGKDQEDVKLKHPFENHRLTSTSVFFICLILTLSLMSHVIYMIYDNDGLM